MVIFRILLDCLANLREHLQVSFATLPGRSAGVGLLGQGSKSGTPTRKMRITIEKPPPPHIHTHTYNIQTHIDIHILMHALPNVALEKEHL